MFEVNKMANMERIYLSNLVGKTIECVYDKLYDNKNGHKQIRIKVDGEDDKILVLNDNEAKFFGNLFRKGNRLQVYKNKKGFANVKLVGKQEDLRNVQKKEANGKKQQKRTISEAYMRAVLRNSIKQLKAELEKSLLEKGFDRDAVDKMFKYIDEHVSY